MLLTITCLAGIVIFAYYVDKDCDPLSAELVDNSNQVRLTGGGGGDGGVGGGDGGDGGSSGFNDHPYLEASSSSPTT